MNDTTPEAQEVYDRLMKKFSGEEKMLMASNMFDTAREIVLASLDENLSENEKRKMLFLRFYKNDFSEEVIKEILNAFDAKFR